MRAILLRDGEGFPNRVGYQSLSAIRHNSVTSRAWIALIWAIVSAEQKELSSTTVTREEAV
jgi:hypothetical protein